MDFLTKFIQVLSVSKIALAIELVTSAMIARYLGVMDYGIYITIYLIPLFVSSIGSLGIGPSIIYHLNNFNESYKKSEIFFTTAIFAVVLGFFYYLLINFIFKDYLNYLIIKNKFDTNLLTISCLIIPILLLQKYIRQFLRGLYKIKEYTLIIDLFPSLIRLPVIFCIIYIYNYRIEGLVFAPLIVQSIVTITLTIVTLKQFDFDSYILEFKKFKNILFFGLKNHIGSVIQKSNEQLIMIIIIPLLAVESIGLISLASKFTKLIVGFTSSIHVVFVPKISKSSNDQRLVLFPRLTRLLILTLISVSVIFVIFLPFFVEIIYGNQFKDTVLLAYILIPGTVALAVVRTSNTTFTQSGRPLIKTYVRGSGFILNIIILISLISYFGMYAPMISITISYLFMLFVSLLLIKKYYLISYRDILFFNKNDFQYLISIFLKKAIKTKK